MIRIIRPPYLLRLLYPDLIWRFNKTEKVMYLTFDDGPTPEVTDWVLSVLQNFNAKACFFCIGRNFLRYPEIVQRVLSAGHTIGNHTQNHVNGWRESASDFVKDVMTFEEVYPCSLFRPPYGKISRAQIKILKQKFRIIMWSVISYDYDLRISKEQCLQNVLSTAGNGSIVVFHDSQKAFKSLKYCLPEVLKHFSDKGYAFRAIQ